MIFTVLCENTTNNEKMTAEHGLSLYIETENHKILFDMGQTDAYIKNARILGIDLSSVDIGILSHGHYDHGGGLKSFLKINNKALIYINSHSFGDYYNATGKYIGLDKSLYGNERLVCVADFLEIDKELKLYSCNGCQKKYATDPYGLSMKEDGMIKPDLFLHEQYLTINDNILISGCSHKGILNIVEWFKPQVFIGGFHFTKIDPTGPDKSRLEQAGKELLDTKADYYTGHCTGTCQYDFLKNIMGDRLRYISTGDTFTIDF